jgi:hypothetical protein
MHNDKVSDSSQVQKDNGRMEWQRRHSQQGDVQQGMQRPDKGFAGRRLEIEGGSHMEAKPSKVWILQAKKLQLVKIMTGLSDNRFVEVISGNIKEGDEVIIGSTSNDVASTSNNQRSPFGPQQMSPMGGGRGGR